MNTLKASLPSGTKRISQTPCALLRGICFALILIGLTPFSSHAAGDLQPLRRVNHNLTDRRFGYAVADVGTNRFAVGLPLADITTTNGVMTNSGIAYIYNLNTNLLAALSNPDARRDDMFGQVIVALSNNMVAVGVPNKDWVTPPPVALYYENGGAVYVFQVSAANTSSLLHSFFNPNANPFADDNDSFGTAVAPLGTNRILIGACQEQFATTNGAGKVYLYELSSRTLLKTIQSPTPKLSAQFGRSIASIGTNRFVVGEPYQFPVSGGQEIVHLYDGQSNWIKTIANPNGFGQLFGYSMAPMGTNDWFAVKSPASNVAASTNSYYS